MRVIAIHPGHNASVGLFENGECKLILHEEKFINVKNYLGFPYKSLERLYSEISFDNIDYFTFTISNYLTYKIYLDGAAKPLFSKRDNGLRNGN